MTWPTTPLTTYLPGSLPAIKAADLNAFQDAINRGFRGTCSYAGLVLDGTGGNTVAPPAGGLAASGSLSAGGSLTLGGRAVGRSLPTPAVQPGVLFGDSCVTAFGGVGPDGTPIGGFGIATIARNSTGSYLITTQQKAPTGWVVVASANTSAMAVVQAGFSSAQSFTVSVFSFSNGAWQPFDAAFQFIAYAI